MKEEEIFSKLEEAYFSDFPDEENVLCHLPTWLAGCKHFVDIGASIGQYTFNANYLMLNGRIDSFEADPIRFKKLKENCTKWQGTRGNMIVAHSVAVAENSGTLAFYSTFSNVSGGIFQTTLGHLDEETRSNVNFKKIQVSSVSLDDFYQTTIPDFIKMDIEGAEGEALQGAVKLLKKRKTIWLIELHGFQGGWSPDEVINFMRGFGLREQKITESHYLFRPVKRIGLIGCGAVTELFHLPPLLASNDCLVTALVDLNVARLEVIGRSVPLARRSASVSEVLSEIDAAIVAVPHSLHATIAVELLRANKHVLVEKPLALTSDECDLILEAAKSSGATITVGHMRRFCPAVAFARDLIRFETMGDIHSVDVADGTVFGWPVNTDFQFRRDTAGGGVLVDTGAHTLDMVLGWFGDVLPVSYYDDSCGGVEADCIMELRLPDNTPCRVELSRTRNLRNSAIIEAERGRIEVFFYDNKVVLTFSDGFPVIPIECTPQTSALTNPSLWRHMFDYQLDNWLDSITQGHPALVSGEEGEKVVRLIEKLQAMRKPLIHPWESFPVQGESS